MGKGIDLIRTLSPAHADLLDDLKEQLIIVLMKRLGGVVDIPVAELDDTGQDLMMMSMDPHTRVFHFETRKKS